MMDVQTKYAINRSMRKLDIEVQIPQAGQVWRHYKGGLYEVVGTAMDVESEHNKVVYRSADGRLFVRGLSRWSAIVTLKGGLQVQRFTLVEANECETLVCSTYEDTMPAPPVCRPIHLDSETVAP